MAETERINVMLNNSQGPYGMGTGPAKMPKKSLMDLLMPVAGALVGATAVGVVMTNESAMEIATTMNGGLGAAIGYGAGSYLAGMDSSSMGRFGQYLPAALAIGVPSLVDGRIDAVNVGLGLGSVGGAWLLHREYPRY